MPTRPGEHQTVFDDNNTIPRSATPALSNTELSFVGEVSAYMTVPVYSFLTARIRLQRHLDHRIWRWRRINSTSRTTATSGTALNAHEGVIIHGFNAGVEARW